MNKSQCAKKIGICVALYIVTAGIIVSVFMLTPDEGNKFPLLRICIILFATILLAKYFIYMSVSPWYDVVVEWKLRRTYGLDTPEYAPRVSVIVPAWNEEVGLVETVKTIVASKYRNVEVVVVNDGSTDNSDKIIRKYITAYRADRSDRSRKIDILYHYKENGGKGRALNAGIKVSTGEIIISIDADCVLTPETIGNFVKSFADRSVMAAVGNVKIGNTGHIIGMLQYLEFLFSFYFKKADSLFNTIYIIGGAAGAFRREVFEKIGVYDPANITEDIELSVRIQAAGMKIVYASDAIVYTEGATTFGGLSAQRLRWKRGRFMTFFAHRKLFFSLRSKHNKALTWLVLPLAVFGDMQLFFEIAFLVFLYAYSFATHDFASFIPGILVVGCMFFVQIMDDRSVNKAVLYVLAPIGWLLFYVTTVIEYWALVKSLWGIARRNEVTWQKWKRTGVGTIPQLAGINSKI